MKRIPFRTACLLSSIVPAIMHAQTSSTIAVDYTVDKGPSNQIASRGPHATSAQYPAQYLIDGIKVNSSRGADYYTGGYLPAYFESATYNRAHATKSNRLPCITLGGK